MPDWITMNHPDISGTAQATVEAFNGVWEPLGWELVEPEGPSSQLPYPMRYFGDWGVSVLYSGGDVVRHESQSWVALEPTEGDEPGVSPEWALTADSSVPPGTFVESAEAGTTIGSGAVVVGAPVVTYVTKWGIAAGVPYYDEDGAAPGEEAILVASHFVNEGGVPKFSDVPLLTLIPITSA